MEAEPEQPLQHRRIALGRVDIDALLSIRSHVCPSAGDHAHHDKQQQQQQQQQQDYSHVGTIAALIVFHASWNGLPSPTADIEQSLDYLLQGVDASFGKAANEGSESGSAVFATGFCQVDASDASLDVFCDDVGPNTNVNNVDNDDCFDARRRLKLAPTSQLPDTLPSLALLIDRIVQPRGSNESGGHALASPSSLSPPSAVKAHHSAPSFHFLQSLPSHALLRMWKHLGPPMSPFERHHLLADVMEEIQSTLGAPQTTAPPPLPPSSTVPTSTTITPTHSSLAHQREPSDSPKRKLLHREPTESAGPARLFIAGDRMSVGKTSVCLGLLGSLVNAGYDPSTLAYIKPATQNEDEQLVAKYCRRAGIHCVPIGPIVYYRGFTRAFLAGETDSTQVLLNKVSEVVDQLAQGHKRVIIIDGVGFPAVGSICGTDNATVARACGSPVVGPGRAADPANGASAATRHRQPPGVLLVGGVGVGSAVDSYNLNRTYFEQRGVPVVGAIFNKLPLDGFYSLENCREQVGLYFAQNPDKGRPFGFVPLMKNMSVETIDEYIRLFGQHVDVTKIIDAAAKASQSSIGGEDDASAVKRQRMIAAAHPTSSKARSRAEIEQGAIKAGAQQSE